MSRNKKISEEELKKREDELLVWCYENEGDVRFDQYEKYHFRIFGHNGKIVDVWPVSKKYWNSFMPHSMIYKHPDDFKKYLI